MAQVTRKPGREYLLTVRARATQGLVPLVDAGTVIGWEQFPLQGGSVAQPPTTGAVSVTQAGDSVRMAAGGATLTLDRKTGLLRAYTSGGRMLAQVAHPTSGGRQRTPQTVPALRAGWRSGRN